MPKKFLFNFHTICMYIVNCKIKGHGNKLLWTLGKLYEEIFLKIQQYGSCQGDMSLVNFIEERRILSYTL